MRFTALIASMALVASLSYGDEPSVSYIFPAGGQRGATVDFRLGGHFLHERCPFVMLGPGVEADAEVRRIETIWFEGPLVPLPESQAQENYPLDYGGQVRIAADATPGVRYWQVWTAQGTVPAMKFMVGELPEVVEQEIDGEPLPVLVQLPVTTNGRMFPREDVDLWSFAAAAGQTVNLDVWAARLGSPLDSQLEVLDAAGKVLAENSDAFGTDSFLRFTAPADGVYTARLRDANYGGLQHYVYRLTISSAPHVDAAYPLGGRRGTPLHLELSGNGLPAEPLELLLPADGPTDLMQRLTLGGQVSDPFWLELDDLNEQLEVEPNNESAQAAALAVPAVGNGRISSPGDVDWWRFAAAKGEAFDLDLRAARLGSPLDSVLVVCDSSGQELGRSDDIVDGQTDSRLAFTAPADGEFRVRVEERFASRGGPQFAYRLRVGRPPEPDFRLTLAVDALTLNRGGEAKLQVNAERLGGFNDAISLALDGLPSGVTVSDPTIPAGAGNAQLSLKADAAAPIRAARIVIRGTAKIQDQAVTRTAAMPAARGSLALESVLLAVSMPTPFKLKGEYLTRYAPRGTVFSKHYAVDRGGYEGPLTIRLADRQGRHLQGVTGPEITVPAGQSEFDYPVNLPPWMEIGRTSRTNLMAVGEIADAEGNRHKVSFSSVDQNLQVVVLVDPGPLGLQTETASLAMVTDHTVDLPVRLLRDKTVTGPVTVELLPPRHVAGIAAEKIVIPADQDRGVLAIRFSPGAGPFNAPLLVRASGTWRDGPVVAETKVSVVPAESAAPASR